MGQAIPINAVHPDYQALRLGIMIFGLRKINLRGFFQVMSQRLRHIQVATLAAV